MFFISALCLVMEKSWFEFPINIEFMMCLRVDQQQVEKVQRRAMKLIPELHHLPYQWQLQELKTPYLYYRCRRGDMIAIYQLLQGKLDLDPHIFDTAVVCDNRGHQWKAKSHHTHLTQHLLSHGHQRLEQPPTRSRECRHPQPVQEPPRLSLGTHHAHNPSCWWLKWWHDAWM